ncbi:4-hydroxy-tetrahydrodipicolinate synthase [Noviherbaspirillum saxi]|uniref:4-hydroxy-tetrahydrodipicolinate synthase n=1 Tax=Noviherbaspirillum saxi TaxID=2320863 RepID=A0A3A3FLI9_9BURK|nr:4-hydroxy-tetrahydrodipicolinate synthase [Noviherbaspirillum saxi]RJF95345.1 4-hydroxy-tetrahydrodipicolinate synthase [Noviherbaspirillum saxi]
MNGFSGIWVALATPFQQGEIDFAALGSLAARLYKDGAAGLVVCGSTGEASALSNSEQLAVLDAVLVAVPQCPVVMGIGGSNQQALVERLREIQARPVAGVLVPPPYYIRPSQEGIVAFFMALAQAATVPLILYNIPYRTGVAMSLATIRAIAEHPRIAAIKDCGGDPALTLQLITDRRLAVLAGEDGQIFSTLCLGGAGAIAAAAHIRTDLFVRMARAIAESRLDEARRLMFALSPLFATLFAEPNPGPLKAALEMMNLCSGDVRAPMQPASAALKREIAQVLDRLNAFS